MTLQPEKKESCDPSLTDGVEYTDLLVKRQLVWWKRLINVQAPYRWNLRRLEPGYVLDIGCGIGRNLAHLNNQGVGIDLNPHSVDVARRRGLIAFTNKEFETSQYNVRDKFDSILFAHVAEHIGEKASIELLKKYIILLRPEGRLIIISPQEAGYKHGPAHIEFIDFMKMRHIVKELNLTTVIEYSFPLARVFGHVFSWNEFISVSHRKNVT